MPVKNKSKEVLREVRFLHRALFGMLLIIAFLGYGLWRIPQQFVIYTAPDVSKAFVQKVGEVPPASVYGFARTLWESINYCQKDCGSEYLENLNRYYAYLTDSCYLELKDHFERNRSLYSFRARMLLPTERAMYSPENIRQMSTDSWFVKLEYLLRDTVNGTETLNTPTLYPIKVVRSGKPLSANPLGLEVDCYWGNGPERIEPTQEANNAQ